MMPYWEKPVISYVKADQGYFAVFPCHEDERVMVSELYEMPIIAFQISDEVTLEPKQGTDEYGVNTVIKYVTAEDVYSDECYLKMPDGTYVDPMNRRFSSREDLIEYINSNRK